MLRLVLSPRWIVWHVLTLGGMVTCGFLAAWQWDRAGSAMGSAVNIGYGVQWPLFAVFFGVMWWRLLRMEVRELRGTAPGAGDAMPGEPDAGEPGMDPSPPAAGAEPAEPVLAARATSADGSSPFRRSPQRAAPVTETESPGLVAYNRMLAALAERDSRGD